MKNTTQWVEFRVYDKPEARTLINKTKQQLGESAKEAGKRDAESNLPRKTDKLLPFVGHLLSLIQQLINELRNLHKADENVAHAIEKQERLLGQARNDRDEIQARYAQEKKAYQNHKDSFPSAMAIGIAVIILLFCIGEGAISFQPIRVFVPDYLTAMFTALVYGLCLTILAHQVLRWWYMGKKTSTRLLIRILIVGGISGAFYMMGLLRSGQINMSTASLEESTSGSIFSYADPVESLLFMFISWVVFLPAVLLTKLAPTRDQWFSIFKARSLKKEVKNTERKLEEQLENIAHIQDEIENLKQFEISRNQTAKRDEEDALSLVEHIKTNYVQSNIRYRLDTSPFPNCFEQEIRYPLTTYFQNTIPTSKTSKK